jgi:hypothetical protein
MPTSRASVLDSCVFICYLRNGWYAARVEGLDTEIGDIYDPLSIQLGLRSNGKRKIVQSNWYVLNLKSGSGGGFWKRVLKSSPKARHLTSVRRFFKSLPRQIFVFELKSHLAFSGPKRFRATREQASIGIAGGIWGMVSLA